MYVLYPHCGWGHCVGPIYTELLVGPLQSDHFVGRDHFRCELMETDMAWPSFSNLGSSAILPWSMASLGVWV